MVYEMENVMVEHLEFELAKWKDPMLVTSMEWLKDQK
jgi:hypothetical protein